MKHKDIMCLRESLTYKPLEATQASSEIHCTCNLPSSRGIHYRPVLEAKQWVPLGSAAVLNFSAKCLKCLSFYAIQTYFYKSSPQAHPVLSLFHLHS